MEKLSALDANFLYLESEKVPNHVSSLQVFESPQDQDINKFTEGLKHYLVERRHLLPYLTRKLKFTPGNIDHPVWTEDREFDIDNHIVVIELEQPGTFAQLEEKVAEIHAVLMDRNIPLWKIFLISGLEAGQFAYYSQAHHACLDGVAGQAATMTLMDTTPNHRAIQVPTAHHPSGDNNAELFRLSFQNLLNFQLDRPRQALNIVDALLRLGKRAIDPQLPTVKLLSIAPKTRFNRCIAKARTYAAGQLSVKDMKSMAKLNHCKLNDIFLAVCAGGLRSYLLRASDLPNRALIAACPVSLRVAGDNRMDNKVTMMSVGLGTDIADPLLRLNAIINSSRIAKEQVAYTAALQNTELSVFGLPAAITAAARFAETMHLAEFLASPANVVISNIPGPREPLYSNGCKMLSHYPVSIPSHGMAVNITGTSYVDDFCFSITACARALPDACALRKDIIVSYRQLKALILLSSGSVEDLPAAKIPAVAMPNVAFANTDHSAATVQVA